MPFEFRRVTKVDYWIVPLFGGDNKINAIWILYDIFISIPKCCHTQEKNVSNIFDISCSADLSQSKENNDAVIRMYVKMN